MRRAPIHVATLIFIFAFLYPLLPADKMAMAAGSSIAVDLSAQSVHNQRQKSGNAAPASRPAPRASGLRHGPAPRAVGPRSASPRMAGPRRGPAPRAVGHRSASPRAVGPRRGPAPRVVTPRSASPRVVGPRSGLRAASPTRRGPPRVVTFTAPRVVNGGRLRGISLRGPATTVIRGRNFSAWRYGYRIRYHNRWRTFVALGALGAIAVGSVTYYPYAYLSAPRPFCDGLTEDGCQMMWQDVETIEDDIISQCVAYCPWQE